MTADPIKIRCDDCSPEEAYMRVQDALCRRARERTRPITPSATYDPSAAITAYLGPPPITKARAGLYAFGALAHGQIRAGGLRVDWCDGKGPRAQWFAERDVVADFDPDVPPGEVWLT
jgi:hypothetical protein